MHEEAELLPEILAAAEIDDPVLVGHSDGASIAIIHAGSGGKARALVLERRTCSPRKMGLRSIANAREAYERGDLRQRLAKHHRDVDAAFWGWNRPWLDPEFASGTSRSSCRASSRPSWWCRASRMSTGRRSRSTPYSVAQPTQGSAPSRCGHSPHKDQPEATLRGIADFVRRCV